MQVLADSGAEVYDVEQVVLRERLTLGVVIEVPEGRATLKDLLFFGWEQGLTVDFEVVEEATPSPPPVRFAVTVIGPRVGPQAFGAVAAAIAEAGGNIERIERLSRYPVVSYELSVAGGDGDSMRAALLGVAASHQVDVAVQPERLERRAKRLVVLDVDSTLIQDEVIDLLAEEAGVGEQVAEITRRAMSGEVEFEQALRERVRLLAGLREEHLQRVWERVRLTPGARTFVATLRRLGMRIAIVSGGFTWFTFRLQEALGVDHAIANQLEMVDGTLTGELVGPVVDRAGKAAALRRVAAAEGIPLEQTVAVGDGANDLDMLAAAGLGIAFNAKPTVRELADTSLSVPYLDAVLFLLGLRRDEVDESHPVPVEGLPPV